MKLKTVLLALSAALSFNAYAQAPIVIKFSHVVATDTPKGQAAERFKQLAEKATNGRVKVEVYPNSQLYKDKEELEALQLGAVQMLAPSLAKFGPLGVKEFEAFDLPYIFPSKAALYNVTEGEIGKGLMKKLEPKGITGLAFWDNGFKVMSANKPLRTPADFRGLKMRIQSSKVLDAQMRALGANPQVLAFSEVYQALQTGVVDGTENPPSNMYTQKMHEVQKYMTVSNHGYLGYAVIVNKKFWDGLPADIRTALDKAMRDATTFEKAIAQRDNDMALEAIKKTGKTDIYTLSVKEQAEWRKALLPVQQSMESRIGKDLISAINKEAAQVNRCFVAKLPRDGARPSRFCPPLEGYLMKFLDKLEEWLIASLMATATILIFVAVVHRYLSGLPIPWLQDTLIQINTSWAQELCIYMFVWMAKFGAAYGVRTGIHVGVDVHQPHEHAVAQQVPCSACWPARCSPASSAPWARASSMGLAQTDQTSADLEMPMWIVYLAVRSVPI
jgi:C4-dicarboxylate-binding protein DctP